MWASDRQLRPPCPKGVSHTAFPISVTDNPILSVAHDGHGDIIPYSSFSPVLFSFNPPSPVCSSLNILSPSLDPHCRGPHPKLPSSLPCTAAVVLLAGLSAFISAPSPPTAHITATRIFENSKSYHVTFLLEISPWLSVAPNKTQTPYQPTASS